MIAYGVAWVKNAFWGSIVAPIPKDLLADDDDNII